MNSNLPEGAETHPLNPANQEQTEEVIYCEAPMCGERVEEQGDVCVDCQRKSDECGECGPASGIAQIINNQPRKAQQNEHQD